MPRMTFDKHEHRDGRENVHHYEVPDPNFTIYIDHNDHHHIEYRLIHIPTGVYTDMMNLNLTSDANVLDEPVQSRPTDLHIPAFAMKASFNGLLGGNLFNEEQILPLVPCSFHGFELWCPNQIESVLRQKYSSFDDPIWYQSNKKANFNQDTKCWERIKEEENGGRAKMLRGEMKSVREIKAVKSMHEMDMEVGGDIGVLLVHLSLCGACKELLPMWEEVRLDKERSDEL